LGSPEASAFCSLPPSFRFIRTADGVDIFFEIYDDLDSATAALYENDCRLTTAFPPRVRKPSRVCVDRREFDDWMRLSMNQNKTSFPKEKTNRIVLFVDLRDSTEILVNFEQGIYQKREGQSESGSTYEKFILDVHETSYKELYLEHENTYAEIYGDGVMGVLPEDNTKYILENIYRLTKKMRIYNDSPGVGVSKPRIDIGCGITVGKVSFVYYALDERHHAVGHCIHEAARIEAVSLLYDARILVSERFMNFAEGFLNSDPRFSYRFIDRILLKGFREPLALFELLLDHDPRFEIKKNSISLYSEAYSKYCERKWGAAKEIFCRIHQEYGLGVGAVMANRCDVLAGRLPTAEWNGIWELNDK
jgi:hypothetical protein